MHRDVAAGAAPVGAGLSRRERQVAALVAEGLSNRQIVSRLFVSERTAEGHVEHIRNKLGFHSRAEIAAWFTRRAGEQSAELITTPNNLPREITSFIGRERELTILSDLLPIWLLQDHLHVEVPDLVSGAAPASDLTEPASPSSGARAAGPSAIETCRVA